MLLQEARWYKIRPGYFTECYCSKQDGTRLDQVILRNVTAVSKMVQELDQVILRNVTAVSKMVQELDQVILRNVTAVSKMVQD